MKPVQNGTGQPLAALVSNVEKPLQGRSNDPVTAAAQSVDELELSALGKQLSAAIERADARDSSLSRKELAALGARIWEQVAGASYYFAKKLHDAYVPNTDDPALLARAEQATNFVNGRGQNPFKALGREELSAIVYDESGDFSVNERNAAWKEINQRDCDWSREVCDQLAGEYQRTGKTDRTSLAILAHYRGLPRIEEAQLLGNYEVDILMNRSASDADWPEFCASLFELIEKQWLQPGEASEPEPAGPSADLAGREAG
ncbi:hypothetical protein [Pseudomonas sp. TWI628]|uniref:hypothetical protein n=1 Tax=Pseudomonas sp. TWI628 TaxID=3136788 RepID=UPI003207A903